MEKKKRSAGRPVGTGKGYEVPLGSVLLTVEIDGQLRRVCEVSGLKRSEVTRRALATWLAAWEGGSPLE